MNWLNLRPEKPQRIGMAEDAVNLFADHGFLEWGGYWDTPIDYQHFQILSRKVANRLVQMPFEAAQAYFNTIINYYINAESKIEAPRAVSSVSRKLEKRLRIRACYALCRALRPST